uniref:NADH dehydrogenase subunit 6 n=1 Tax=Bolitaena pygmaea TaxID=61709 RepID=UPI0022FD8762|nr:NADH dehydrogenase subunit 6 [Bolitaena pygmaea]WAP91588.1 NADH dehydrogenase subunit 6 [Bolitaena pygmaea]
MGLMVMFSFGLCLISVLIVMIQPLSLGFVIMMISGFMSVVVSFFIYSWYGFILFLVYIGGLMVMFTYVISLVPNLIFFSKGVLLYVGLLFASFMVVNFFFMFKSIDLSTMSMNLMGIKDFSLSMSSLIMSSYNFLTYVFLGVLLLLILISVVKICYYCEGPLRVFKYKYA